ncbi:MAG: cation diffusion facilitator family transporter [Opitutaceae bacterium]
MPHRQADHFAAIQARARLAERLVLRGIALNAILAVAKFTGGVMGSTYALIADGVESLLDIATSTLVWAGFKWAARPPDADHPYGHGKAEAVAAFGVALVIMGAAYWIGRNAVHEIITPHRGPHWATLPLLAGIVIVKTVFSRRMNAEGKNTASTALGAEAWHHFSDAVTSAAAFVGIAVAIAGGPGYESADDWGALLACAVIGWNGVTVFRQALGDIMDSAAPTDLDLEVRRVAQGVEGVVNLDKCRVRKSGLSYLVDIHVRVDPTLTVAAGHEIAHAVKDALLESSLRIGDVLVHIEPAEGS